MNNVYHRKSDELSNTSEDRILLEETFYVLRKKNSVFKVKLTNNGLNLVKETEHHIKESSIPIMDIIGCRCLRSKKQTNSCTTCKGLPRSSSSNVKVVDANSDESDDSDASAYLYIYAYILQCNKGSCPVRRVRTVITLRFRSFDLYEDNYREAQRWRSAIKQLIRGVSIANSAAIRDFCPKENRKLLVLCNPKSGPGKGKQIFQEKVAPVLKEAEIPFDLHITKYANFARQFVRQNDIFQWSGIVTVGGDGIIFEVINGLFERPDWSDAINRLAIGVVPGGSGNGLARSIAHSVQEPYLTGSSALPSALSLVRGQSGSLDLVRVETRGEILFSFLSVGWGFLADVDIESERLRVFGGQRFTVWSVARLIGLKTYRGTVWYLPALPVSTGAGESNGVPTDCNNLDVRMHGPASTLPCLTSSLASNQPLPWKRVDGPFAMVYASSCSHLSEDCLFVPNAKLDDGAIWLVIVKADITRPQMLQFLLGLSNGTHLNQEIVGKSVELHAVRAFRIEPDPAQRGGHMTVDGELVQYGPVQAEIFPGLGRIMLP